MYRNESSRALHPGRERGLGGGRREQIVPDDIPLTQTPQEPNPNGRRESSEVLPADVMNRSEAQERNCYRSSVVKFNVLGTKRQVR